METKGSITSPGPVKKRDVMLSQPESRLSFAVDIPQSDCFNADTLTSETIRMHYI